MKILIGRPKMSKNSELKIGASSAAIKAEDNMVIGGGIFPLYLSGQEGELRASAIIFQKDNTNICMVSCDVLMISKDILKDVCEEIKNELGIPFENILIYATHTHHAPTTVTLHGYQREELFCERLKKSILAAVKNAHDDLQESEVYFAVGNESEVGQNSRVQLDDGTVLWVPLEEKFASCKSTGPFDSDLPVIGFKTKQNKLKAMVFNHSTHNIGSSANKRSPGFYGLAAQDLEKEFGGTIMFSPGACGSTHNFHFSPQELVSKIKSSVENTYSNAKTIPVDRILSIKNEFAYKVRTFSEAEEENAVLYYCNKRKVDWCENPQDIVTVFRKMREALKPHQGEIRKSWLQFILIGDIAFVAVPGELFGKLAMEIKKNSPFKNTYIVGYANDHIGYIPDKDAFKLGGYQIWTGFHSVIEKGFGEILVKEVLDILNNLKVHNS